MKVLYITCWRSATCNFCGLFVRSACAGRCLQELLGQDGAGCGNGIPGFEPAVFDAGPLIYTDALGYLATLRKPHRVVIPGAVAREFEGRPGGPGSNVPALRWVERRNLDAGNVALVASEPPARHPGEREAIAPAFGMGIRVVVDDRRGRRRARSLGVPLTGTLGVLLALHRTGEAHRSLAEDLDALETAGMYLTPGLKQRVMDRLRSSRAP